MLAQAKAKATGKASAKASGKTAVKPKAEETFVKTLGSSKAPITLEVFSDYQCPACRDLYLKTLRRVIDDYVLTQKVYLVHRDFPLRQHPYAREAARYANAAATIGKYEQVTDALFSKQDVWAAAGAIEPIVANALNPEDMKKVKQALQTSSDRIDSAIERDVFMANQVPVTQTPTMVIHHKDKKYPPQAGIVSYTVLKVFLDDLLTK
jgi:protein-disulfide isomerase